MRNKPARSHLVLGGKSVIWDKIFHVKAFIPPDRDGHILPILTYNIVLNGMQLENANKK
jgi:hypothetical protein